MKLDKKENGALIASLILLIFAGTMFFIANIIIFLLVVTPIQLQLLLNKL